MLYVADSIKYNGYKFVSCTCIDYNNNFRCKHTIALAIKMEFKLKGFELKKKSK